jgi:hypothetical protein
LSLAYGSILPLRFPRLRFSLLVPALATAAALLSSSGPLGAQSGCTFTPASGSTEYSSSTTITTVAHYGAQAPEAASPYPSTITVPNTVTGNVTGVQVELKSVSVAGVIGNSAGLYETQVLLVSPSGQQFQLMGGAGDDSSNAISGVNIFFSNYVSASNFPYLPSTTPFQTSGNGCYAPSSYFSPTGPLNDENPFPYPSPIASGSTIYYPNSDGSSTLTTVFGTGSTPAAGAWKLYVQDGWEDAVTIDGWNLYLTVTAPTKANTTTVLSSSQNPAYATSPNNTVTFTATVSSSGTPTGTVAFYANGSTSPLSCSSGNQTLNGSGQATCGITLTAGSSGSSSSQCSATSPPTFPTVCQGISTITAVYSGSSTYYTSTSAALNQLVEVHPSGSTSTDVWCNDTGLAIPGSNAPALAYPSVIEVSGYAAGSTVSNVKVTLNDAYSSSDINDPFLLVAPGSGGQNLDFLDNGFSASAVNNQTLTFFDTAGQFAPGNVAATTGSYEATDNNQTALTFAPATAPSIDTSIPPVPSTIHYAAYGPSNDGKTDFGTTAYNFGQAFNNAPANGDWALYTYGWSGVAASLDGGWCVTLTLNTGVTSTTTVTSNNNPALNGPGQSVKFTATVTSGGNPVTTGTVTFLDGGQTPAGTSGGNNVVTLNGSGQATFTTSSLTEGDHTITADYSGATDYNPSTGTVDQRLDDATTVSNVTAASAQYCNTGGVLTATGQRGAFTPNPSNIFVTNLPGTVDTVTLTLDSFYTFSDSIYEIESMIAGPTGAALDFFSDTGATNTILSSGNYIFADGHGAVGQSSFGPGTYEASSYDTGANSGGDTYTASPSGFYTLPSSFKYAQPRGNPAYTFDTGTDNVFGTTNPNGTWSLYFNQTEAGSAAGATGGWCLNFTETLPSISLTAQSPSTFTQNGTGSFPVTITNLGSGDIGDPTQTAANAMVVTDTLPAGLTYSSFTGTDWTCSASGQTVTCRNQDTVAPTAEYNPLSISVNVSSTASGSLGNNTVSISDTEASNTPGASSASVTIDVPPDFTSANTTPFTVGSSGIFIVTASGYPAPTFSESGSLPSGVTFTDTGTLSGIPAAGTGGVYSFTITAENGSTNPTQDFRLTVNQAPAITSAAGATFTVGTSGSFSVIASGYPAPTYSVTAGTLPSGVTLTSAGLLSGTPAAATGGTYPITITAANGTTNATQSFTLTVDQAPSITSGNSTTFTVGTSGSFSVTASGYPAPTYTVTAGSLPSGISLSTAGTLSGTPASGTGGIYPITITATNGTTSATQNFTLTVDQAPAITSAASTTFAVGTSGSFSVTASGYPTAMTYSVTAGSLPSGVTLSSAGLLSGTPAASTGNSYAITITASNGIGTAATQSFTLTVEQAPTFNLGASGSDTMAVSTPNIVLIFTTGNPTAAISESGALPSGVTFVDNGNGHGTLSGTPGATTGGGYNLVFTANNGITPNATLNYALTIKQPIVFTSSSGTTFTTGTTGSFTVTTTGYPLPSFSETGTLPSGVGFVDNGNGTASLAGTPAAGTGGTYSITIQATNGSSTPSQAFTLTVDQAPSITSANSTSFVAGAAGTFSVTTTGYPTSALIESGSLPSGITFTDSGNGTGTLAGTTAATGSFPITITASNGISSGAVQSFTLMVNLPQYQITTAANPAAGGAITPVSGSLFNQGTVVPIVATPATGYTFVGWTSAGDPVASATSASTTITLNGPESVTAQFAPTLVVNTANDDSGAGTNCAVQPTPGTTTNSDTCSLRDALLNAASSGAGNITFDSTAFASTNTIAANTIPLSNSTLTIPSNTTITGPTSGSSYSLANLVTVAGGGSSSDFPVFTVNSSATNATISGLTISNGNSTGNAGGIVNGYGSGLTVINSTISGNTASSGTGGIFNDYNATLTVSGSTISGNSGSYGGIVNESGGTVTINSSTIANNTGAGISSIGTSVTVTASTISGNTGGYSGGGINNSSGALTLANSIVAGNTATTSPDVIGTYTDSGGNFIPGVNGVTLAGINLAPLRSYGGPMQTMVPVPGNFAICGGTLTNATAANLTADQRGLPFDPACPSGSVDSGAVQSNYALSFTTEPPSNGVIGAALSPAPVVTLTESGSVFAPATSTVTITDANDGLSPTGTNLAALSSGSATFSNLKFTSVETSDTLTASLSLSPNLSPALNLVAPPSTGINVVSGTPGITSVTPILPQQTQTITISGSGFGTQAPYTGDSQYIELVDTTAGGWAAGHSGAAITLAVSSWTNTQIVLSGFSGSYGTNGWCISPGDQLKVEVWNAQSGDGPAVYPIAASSGTNTCTLSIASVSPIASMQTQTITINGADFGTQSPYTGSSNYIELVDTTAGGWAAGHSGSSVTLAVSSWTNTQIVLSGFSGSYGTNGWCISPGDQLSVKVWNAQSGDGPAVYPITASSGTNTCTLSIASVSPIVSEQTQTITINGADFGTQSPYTGDSNYIELIDTTAGGWAAGHSGAGVTLGVSSWTNAQIVLSGLSGAYGTHGWCIKPGDQLSVQVWNAQTGHGPAVYPITASSGTNTCP